MSVAEQPSLKKEVGNQTDLNLPSLAAIRGAAPACKQLWLHGIAGVKGGGSSHYKPLQACVGKAKKM